MKQVTPILVAMLGLVALASAQAQREGSSSCRNRIVTVGHSEHRAAARAPRRAVATVGRGASYRLAQTRRPRLRCGTVSSASYRTVSYQVWVPGSYRREHVPARYGWVHGECGSYRWGIVEAARTRCVYVPGHYETRTRRVWRYR